MTVDPDDDGQVLARMSVQWSYREIRNGHAHELAQRAARDAAGEAHPDDDGWFDWLERSVRAIDAGEPVVYD